MVIIDNMVPSGLKNSLGIMWTGLCHPDRVFTKSNVMLAQQLDCLSASL